MNTETPKVGDVFAFFLERYGVYCPCQVIFQEENSLGMLFFNHFSKEIPSDVEKILQSGVLLQNHHYWEGDKFAFWVELPLTEHFSFLGNTLIVEAVSREEFKREDWHQLEIQYAWQQLPAFIQENFRIEGQYYNSIVLKEEKSLEELRKIREEFSFSHRVETLFFNEDLKIFLAENPLISTIVILGNASKVVDISRTALTELIINVSGVEQLILNREMFHLTLKGDFSSLKEVVCPFGGKLLHLNLHTDEHFSAFSGLKKAKSLRVDFKNSFDISELKKVLTDTRQLWLMSKGGIIKNILELKDFEKVEDIWLSEVYGFDEFPKKTDLPHLEFLSLWSIPKTIGEQIKKEFKGIHSLEVKQLWSEAWLKANLENPLRNWDGNEGIPATKAKKAMKIYADSYKTISKEGISEEEKQQILLNFLKIFNEIEQKWGIDTLEREEIGEAYHILAQFTTMTESQIEDFFENHRDF